MTDSTGSGMLISVYSVCMLRVAVVGRESVLGVAPKSSSFKISDFVCFSSALRVLLGSICIISNELVASITFADCTLLGIFGTSKSPSPASFSSISLICTGSVPISLSARSREPGIFLNFDRIASEMSLAQIYLFNSLIRSSYMKITSILSVFA